MLIGALIIYLASLFGGGGAAMGPIVADVEDARDRVHLVADAKEERRAITGRIDAVLEASTSRTKVIEKLSGQLRHVSARHDATREELLGAVNALRDAANAELDATIEAYLELRQSLTSEQWATLFPPPPAPPTAKPDA
jgi:hypothetical protein